MMALLTVAYSSLAIGIGPVRRTRAIVAGEFQVGCGLPDRVGGVLAGFQRR